MWEPSATSKQNFIPYKKKFWQLKYKENISWVGKYFFPKVFCAGMNIYTEEKSM